MIVSFGSIQLGQTALEVQNSFIYMPSTFSDYMEDDSADSLTIWSLGLFISLFSRELLHGDPALQEPETEAASSLKVWTWKRHGVTLILLSWSNYSKPAQMQKEEKTGPLFNERNAKALWTSLLHHTVSFNSVLVHGNFKDIWVFYKKHFYH